MKIQPIGILPTFKTVTEERRKPPVETDQQQFHQHNKHSYNPVSITGWTGVGAMAISILSGIKHKNNIHKISAFISAAAITGHVGLIKAYHHKHHKEC